MNNTFAVNSLGNHLKMRTSPLMLQILRHTPNPNKVKLKMQLKKKSLRIRTKMKTPIRATLMAMLCVSILVSGPRTATTMPPSCSTSSSTRTSITYCACQISGNPGRHQYPCNGTPCCRTGPKLRRRNYHGSIINFGQWRSARRFLPMH